MPIERARSVSYLMAVVMLVLSYIIYELLATEMKCQMPDLEDEVRDEEEKTGLAPHNCKCLTLYW